MRAIVLAAGTGSRLKDLTKARTKGMVPVLGKKLIDYLFEFMDLSFFDEVLVVGGYCFEDLRDHIEARDLSNVRVLENEDYLKGNIYTLFRALREFDDDSFLMTNVDHIYPPAMFAKMREGFSGIKGMCDFDRQLGNDDMKVKLDASGKSVVSISKQLDDFDCGYIGMTYVDRTHGKMYRAAAEKAVERFGEKAVVENILQIIADEQEGLPGIVDLSGFGWYEVDDESDLKKAEAGLPDNPNFK